MSQSLRIYVVSPISHELAQPCCAGGFFAGGRQRRRRRQAAARAFRRDRGSGPHHAAARALPLLAQLEAEARRGTPAEQAEFLVASSDALHGMGRHAEALVLCDQALAIGRRTGDNDIIARATLSKAYSLFSLGQTTVSHALVWQAEKLASTSEDVRLRVLTLISSGESFVEDGNFPVALGKLQASATLARESGDPLLIVISLRSLAILHDRMREYGKGFELLDEAMRAARQIHSEGRLALLKSTEYALAMDSNQIERALQAELSALALQRKLDAGPMIGISLVNLADCYLKLRDFPNALSYARQALEQARLLNDQALAATARINIGQAYLAMGRMAEGRKSVQAGLAWFEKSGNKPDLQMALGEYADALARAGDQDAAVVAYQRERALLNELFEQRRQKAMAELQERYETDKKQRQIELLSRENQVKSIEIDNRRLQQRVWWLLALVLALGAIVVGTLYRKVRKANAQLQIRNQELSEQGARDPLTGLFNRRHFQEFMRTCHDSTQHGAGGDTVGAIFLLDVDHFKSINDKHGHAGGDAVLREIAAALRDILRETDMIVRWGGEEFGLPAVRPARPAGRSRAAPAHRDPDQDDRTWRRAGVGAGLDRLRTFPAAAGHRRLVGTRRQHRRHGAVPGQGPWPQPCVWHQPRRGRGRGGPGRDRTGPGAGTWRAGRVALAVVPGQQPQLHAV
ncbi:GGDEF domain-containing protein [Massilia sp. Dwa41.01b]|uniref:diguanylate cyclase domain-containing protein n=1 Tax=Massilia sp. Dwa41.01b TaxID=2709302 RepID=UPI001603F983|nr:diguanylate cyclase [Massilia sp. Dwa41.01b]QNA87572.1 GGDEF domain-containing protein [Massilia sp. Dwa41.01b]